MLFKKKDIYVVLVVRHLFNFRMAVILQSYDIANKNARFGPVWPIEISVATDQKLRCKQTLLWPGEVDLSTIETFKNVSKRICHGN